MSSRALLLERRSCEAAVVWETRRGSGSLTLRLFGRPGPKELLRVAEVIREGRGSPREVLCVDFEEVDHLDFRGIPSFAEALERLSDRGSTVWLVGLRPYLRNLFNVAGQGPTLSRLEWKPEGEAARARVPFPLGTRSARADPAPRTLGL